GFRFCQQAGASIAVARADGACSHSRGRSQVMNENYETQLPETFDPATQEGSKFDVLPVGSYVAQITDASVVQPKSGNGYYIGLSWQITEGDYQGRYVFQNITFLHSSTQATTIGRRQFKDLCVATGIAEQVTDVEVFKFIPCTIKVGIEQDKQGVYPDKNRVSRILPHEPSPKAPQPATAEAKPTPQPDTAGTASPVTGTNVTGAANGSGSSSTAPWRKQR